MTREEAKAILKGFMENPLFSDIPKVCRAFDMAIKALEQQSCNTPRNDIATTSQDCISRQAAIDGLASIAKAKAKSDAQKSLMGRVMFFTEQLPSVTPQKHGKWIRVTDKTGHLVWECDKCSWQQRLNTNFCPDCGAKMQESEE